MISLVKKDYDSTKIYRKTHKKGASQTYDTPSFLVIFYKYIGIPSEKVKGILRNPFF